MAETSVQLYAEKRMAKANAIAILAISLREVAVGYPEPKACRATAFRRLSTRSSRPTATHLTSTARPRSRHAP